MKKTTFVLITTLLFLLIIIYINGYDELKTNSLTSESDSKPIVKDLSASSSLDFESSKNSIDSKLSFIVNEELKPQIKDESASYNNLQLSDLNAKTNLGNISCIYFLDNNNIIFSLYNGANKDNFEENYDLYKYNLESNQLNYISSDYMLYSDAFITVKNSNSFSIIRNGSYLEVENNIVKYKRNFIKDVKSKYPSASSIFYSEDNKQVLILVNNPITKSNGVYVSDSSFSTSEKLPFSNVYSAQWADENNVFIAYKENNGQSSLAKYNLWEKRSIITPLPDETYFIDPTICDNNMVRFFYQEPYTGIPWGFLDINQGFIDRIYFESSNPTSIVRNDKMAGFLQTTADKGIKNQLFVYDISLKSITIRSDSVEFPQTIAVSPDGEKIVFVAGNSTGKSIFYINKKI